MSRKPYRKIEVTREEYEAEKAELEALQKRLSELEAETSRIETEEFDPLWRENLRLVRRIRRLQSRIEALESRLAELRRIGWPRLHAAEREEYRRIISELPEVRERLERLREQQDEIISKLWETTEKLTPKRVEADLLKREIAKTKREIARKIIVVKKVEVCAYLNYVPRSLGGTAKRPPGGGKEYEFKIFRLVREEDVERMRRDTIQLWFDVFDWFKGYRYYCRVHDHYLETPTCPITGEEAEIALDVLYGRTNREWTVPEEEEEAAQAYCLAQKIETKTRRIVAQRAGPIDRAHDLGWDGLTEAEVRLYYGKRTPPEIRPEGVPKREKKEEGVG